jgi:hypothetical protein
LTCDCSHPGISLPLALRLGKSINSNIIINCLTGAGEAAYDGSIDVEVR